MQKVHTNVLPRILIWTKFEHRRNMRKASNSKVSLSRTAWLRENLWESSLAYHKVWEEGLVFKECLSDMLTLPHEKAQLCY